MNPSRTLSRLALAAGALAVAAVVPTGAALATSAHSAAGQTVTIKGIAFHPSTVKIKTGQSVTWRWQDGSITHNVTGSGLHSGNKMSGSYTKRFTKKGTYSFHCTIHPSVMKGKVVVS